MFFIEIFSTSLSSASLEAFFAYVCQISSPLLFIPLLVTIFNNYSAKARWICTRLVGYNLVPRSHSVTGNVRSGKVRFRACSVPARPEIRAFLPLRMFVLSVVILGDFAE